MFKINDVVNYSTTGVCNIVAIEKRELSGVQKEFYVLKPVFDDRATIMVPTDNELLVSRMHRPLSEEEVNSFIAKLPQTEPLWIEDDRLRNEEYKKALLSGDRQRVVSVIKALYIHQKSQSQKGRKLRSMDERLLRDAERLLYSEFAFVLKILPDDVSRLLSDSLFE